MGEGKEEPLSALCNNSTLQQGMNCLNKFAQDDEDTGDLVTSVDEKITSEKTLLRDIIIEDLHWEYEFEIHI